MSRFFLFFPIVIVIVALHSYSTATYMDNFETGDLSSYEWILTGNGQWRVTDTNPNSGTYACQAPALSEGQSAQIATTMQCLEGIIGFSPAISSEQDRDFLYFFIDDELKGSWSGTLDYTPTTSIQGSDSSAAPYTSTVSAGEHTFKWIYAKHENQTSDLDTFPNTAPLFSAWIDDVYFPINDPPRRAEAISPRDEAIVQNIISGILLSTNEYSDPENDRLLRAIWKARRADSVHYFFEKEVRPDDFDLDFKVAQGFLTQNLYEGMKYFWKVGYDAENSGNTAWSKEFAFKIGTSITDNSIIIPPGVTAADFDMVAFIQWPDDPAITSVFLDALGGTYDTRNFRIGTYDPTKGNGQYISYGSTLDITPGRAYWIFARNGLNLNVNGIPVTHNIDVSVPLLFNPETLNGWNMISCPNQPPNDQYYVWDDVMVVAFDRLGATQYGPVSIKDIKDQFPANDNPYIDTRLWRWDTGKYFADTTQIKKYKGYWVKAKALNVSLIFGTDSNTLLTYNAEPAPLTEKKLSKYVQWFKNWEINVRSAIASSDDTPPLPMDDFTTVYQDKGKGICFIENILESND